MFLCFFTLTWLHSSCCFVTQIHWSPTPCRVFAAACHRERESRFRKLEACTLQVFELCHWRQHSHKVDGCPSPEVFPCQQACSAQHRWIQMLSASQTGSFVWVFGKHSPPPSPCAKNHHHHHPLCGTGQKAAFKKIISTIKYPTSIKMILVIINKETKQPNQKGWLSYYFLAEVESRFLICCWTMNATCLFSCYLGGDLYLIFIQSEVLIS